MKSNQKAIRTLSIKMKSYNRILQSGNVSVDESSPHFIIFLSTAAVRAKLSSDPAPRRRDEGQRAPHASVNIQLSDMTLALFHLNSPPETSEG